MTPKSLKRLEDARDACVRIGEFLADVSFDGFQDSELLRSATERQLEIIGEALGQASKEDASVIELIPELPRIVALRNRLIHGYDAIDPELVWDIVRTKIGPLITQLESICDESDCYTAARHEL